MHASRTLCRPWKQLSTTHNGSFLKRRRKKNKKQQKSYAIQRRAHFVYSYLIHAQRPLFSLFSPSQYVYHLHSVSSPLAACPQGTFKSFQGAGLCQQCPLNSRSTIEAATLCGCRNGYYRGDMDKPEDMCTSESVSTHSHTHINIILCKPFWSVMVVSCGVSNTPAEATVWTAIAERESL